MKVTNNMKLGFIGLGKMGGGMSRRLARNGVEVHGYAPSQESRDEAAKAGVTTHGSREELLEALGEHKAVWLMIPAHLVSEEIKELSELLPKGSILIDGGNTKFQESIEHAELLAEKGIDFIDAGVSGGQVGEEEGYCIMAGGAEQAWSELSSYLETLAQPSGYGFFGPAGAGHFVKMVHNAIEYGIMESFAEGFELIHEGPYKNVNLGDLAQVWQNGSIIESFINSLAVDIFKENPNLDGIEGKVNMLGEAQWAAEYAKSTDVELGSVEHAIEKRAQSQDGNVSFGTKYLAATRNAFGGHSLNKISADQDKGATRNV